MVVLRPRYQASRNFPAAKSTDVTNAPTQTSRQAIFTSGSTLKIIANKTVMTANEIKSLVTTDKTPTPGKSSFKNLLNAASAALTTSDTSSKKPIPTTIANESNR